MNNDELLRPRIKCIARYPDSPFPIGAILEQDFEEPELYHYMDSNRRPWILENPELYPEIFKSVTWWEDRASEEMPAYVKDHNAIFKAHWRTEKSDDTLRMQLDDGYGEWYVIPSIMYHFEPATEEEYIRYKNQNKKS